MSIAAMFVLTLMLWWAGVSLGVAIVVLFVTFGSDIVAHAMWARWKK